MNFLVVILTIPFMISIVSYLWARFFEDEERFPGGPSLHALLVVIQFAVLTSYYVGWQQELSTILLAGLYIVQALGVTYFLLNKRSGEDCGCFGSQINSKLDWKLIVLNIGLACGVFWSTSTHISLSVVEGIGFLCIVAILCLLFSVGIPDGLYAFKGYKRSAKKYYSIVKGYKELIP